MEDKINNKLKSEYYVKQKKLDKVINNSFILKKEKKNDNEELTKIIKKNKINLKIKEKIKKSSKFSKERLFYFCTKNVDFLTSYFIQFNLLNFTHPLYNLKIRQQSFNFFEDVSFMRKFKTEQTSKFKGISYSYSYSFIYFFLNFRIINTGDKYLYNKFDIQNFILKSIILESTTDIISLPIRTFLEIKRCLSIMNTKKNYLGFWKTYKLIFFPMIIRDILFRINFNYFYFTICSKYKNDDQIPIHYRTMGIITGTLIGCFITGPFDLIITKIITQQIDKYNGFKQTFETIYKQEGLSRILFSGYSFRSIFIISNSIGLISIYNKLFPLFNNYFNPEKILYF